MRKRQHDTGENTMAEDIDMHMIVQLHLRRLRERKVLIQPGDAMAIGKLFMLGDREAAEKRAQVTEVASLEIVLGRTMDPNVVHSLMLCIPPKKALQLFPNLQENIWAISKTMSRAWRTREAVRMSNDLASSGLLFYLDNIQPNLMYSALLYFTLGPHLDINRQLIGAMNKSLNIDASMFAEFYALSKALPGGFTLPPNVQSCIDSIMASCPSENTEDAKRVTIAPFVVLFDDDLGRDQSNGPPICAYDVVLNICAAIGMPMPLAIQSKMAFGARKLVYFPRFSCNIDHPALNLCIPLSSGTIAVLNSKTFWAPPAAYIKGFQMGASPVSTQLSIESSFTEATTLQQPLHQIHRFYTVFVDYVLGASDGMIEGGNRNLFTYLMSKNSESLFINLQSENAILAILTLMMDDSMESNIGDDLVISMLAYMHAAIPELHHLMEKISLIAPGSQYEGAMPMGALIVAHVDAPKYIDPCLWSCIHLYPVQAPTPPPREPVDIFTGIYEEARARVAEYAEWPMDFVFGAPPVGAGDMNDEPDQINHEFI
jgi:hypothetical protein